ncbi:hypothetical protein RCG24_11405 [Neobacillus sp. OS1-32]|jgi:hypothetical protein|uniref:hypothetical protein n=1 Tax=Neobacillus sp. OS1-32 TaxID=3070682 RepID=UPI0027E07E42|nr:hypothetical protein [Neobacillus sp. OS1-32]WML28654.1 hypothetical protein RCG24_11405 [Neobacillus sp. OS1-32]
MRNKLVRTMIGTTLVALVGFGGFASAMELKEEKGFNGSYTQFNYHEVEGKVKSLSKNKMVVSFPFGGSRTYKITKNTRIEDYGLKLKRGVLVEVEANGKTAQSIDTERTIDSHGIIVSDSKKQMKIKYRGITKSFTKAAHYYLDRDGYRGSLKGVPVEIKLDRNFKLLSAEIDDD